MKNLISKIVIYPISVLLSVIMLIANASHSDILIQVNSRCVTLNIILSFNVLLLYLLFFMTLLPDWYKIIYSQIFLIVYPHRKSQNWYQIIRNQIFLTGSPHRKSPNWCKTICNLIFFANCPHRKSSDSNFSHHQHKAMWFKLSDWNRYVPLIFPLPVWEIVFHKGFMALKWNGLM